MSQRMLLGLLRSLMSILFVFERILMVVLWDAVGSGLERRLGRLIGMAVVSAC